MKLPPPYGPSVPLLGIYPKETRSWCLRVFCTHVFITALFFFYFILFFKLYIIVLVLPNIKMNPPQVYMCSPYWTLLPPPSPFHPSGSSLAKTWKQQTCRVYQQMPFVTTWMDLEGIMLNEISQRKINTIINFYLKSKKRKNSLKRGKICGYQRRWVRGREIGWRWSKVYTSSYKSVLRM